MRAWVGWIFPFPCNPSPGFAPNLPKPGGRRILAGVRKPPVCDGHESQAPDRGDANGGRMTIQIDVRVRRSKSSESFQTTGMADPPKERRQRRPCRDLDVIRAWSGGLRHRLVERRPPGLEGGELGEGRACENEGESSHPTLSRARLQDV
ncbi:hypothetical protein llg_43280 [Luteolibacter sp. LG18]|nr:hypothetical protein llg_43280 [Luteolibacter sp. LG18]